MDDDFELEQDWDVTCGDGCWCEDPSEYEVDYDDGDLAVYDEVTDDF